MDRPPGATWAVVLAAGEGTRLRSLTTDSGGRSTPKQYCSLFGGPTLLECALERAQAVAQPQRTCTIVAAEHACWWEGLAATSPAGNLIAQPSNRGTANGVLLALLSVLARDPEARILFLPADHFVAHEDRLAQSAREAVQALEQHPQDLILIGIEPDEADPELGYILPQPGEGRLPRVERFVEKPAAAQARELIDRGALWNSFIFAARGRALLERFRARMPVIVEGMQAALAREPVQDGALAEFYSSLPAMDFSRDVAADTAGYLRVIPAPACGWTDLGTASRVRDAVQRGSAHPPYSSHTDSGAGRRTLTLAEALLRLQFAW